MNATRVAIACFIAATFAAQAASATEAAVCAAAHEKAQLLRKEGQLRAARIELETCASPGCPAVLQKDCAQWSSEVEAELPSIVIGARDATGRDIANVRVLVDAEVAADAYDGRTLPLDHGNRKVRCEAAGFEPAEQLVVIRAGEKRRLVTCDLRPLTPSVVKIVPPSPPPPAPAPELPPSRPWALIGVLGAVSVVAFGVETYFGVTGIDRRSDARTQADIDDARTRFIVADVSLAVALITGGIAAWLIVAPPAGAARAAAR